MHQPDRHNTLPPGHESEISSTATAALGNVAVQTTIERRTGPSAEAITRLETASMPLPMKIDALLVALGEKPATLDRFASPEWKAGGEPQNISEAAAQEYIETVKGLGVYVEVVPDKVVNPWAEYTKGSDGEVVKRSHADWQEKVHQRNQQTWRTVLVARSPEDMDLIRAGNEKNDAWLLGQAYGFPETATEAYLNGRPMYPSEVSDGDISTLAFARYGLSAEHASDELATAARWAAAIQQTSPQLYSEMVEQVRGAG